MTIPTTLAALVSDILSLDGVPGGALLQEATKRVVERRLAQAREIWLEEMRRGTRHIMELGVVDEAAAIIFRYHRAAIEGTARLNLRLLAAVAAGQSERGSFAADEFLAWADVLAALRREELILIASLWRVEQAAGPAPSGQSAISDPVWTQLERQVIPDPFKTPEAVTAAAGACVRTGLLTVTGGTWDRPVTFVTTPRLTELLALVPLAEILRRGS